MLTDLSKSFFDFVELVGNLKLILRNCKTSEDRTESVAEHCFRLAFMVAFGATQYSKEVNIEKAIKLALVHDVVEVYSGDFPYSLTAKSPDLKQHQKLAERKALERILSKLSSSLGQQIEKLWTEFEDQKTLEAKFVFAMDKLEGLMQFNEGPASNWGKREKEALGAYLSEIEESNSFVVDLKEMAIEKTNQSLPLSRSTDETPF